MQRPSEVGDTIYIVGKISALGETHPGMRQIVRVVTSSKNDGDSFLMYLDQACLIEPPDDDECVD